MSLTQSNMLPLGTKAPDFTLTDTVDQSVFTLGKQNATKATLILFICNHCPYVRHILPTLLEVAMKYQLQGVQVIAISSNDPVQYVADSPENMHETAKQHDFSFPYLFDETQDVAKKYQAACTPDFYLFDDKLQLAYRGRFDASSPGNDIPVTGDELMHAMDCLLENKPVSSKQYPSIGCNIKWKA